MDEVDDEQRNNHLTPFLQARDQAGSSGARTMAFSLQRIIPQGCGAGSFWRNSGRASLSYYRKGGTSPTVESDEDLQPNWR